jgi:hypothetical protein
MSSLVAGQLVKGKGVFVGVWTPVSPEGRELETKYAVYAAPEDLKQKSGAKVWLSFKKAAAQVAKLRNFHGHDGADIKSEADLFEKLESKTYDGGWFVPTMELLSGREAWGRRSLAPNLYKLRKTGDFEGSFDVERGHSQYMSCSPSAFGCLAAKQFSDKYLDKDGWTVSLVPERARMKCRLVRLVPLPR